MLSGKEIEKQMWASKKSNKCPCPRHNVISTLHLGRTGEVLHEVHDKAAAIFWIWTPISEDAETSADSKKL